MGFRNTAALCGLLATVISPVAALADPPMASPREVGFDKARLDRIDPVLQGYVDRKELPGVSLLVARHGKVVYLKSFGERDLEAHAPMAEDTVVRIYSMSKPITAAAAMVAYEEGDFLLSDPVAKYVPEFAKPVVYAGMEGDSIKTVPALRPMTIDNLLTHTAGFTFSFQAGTPVAKLYTDAGLTSARWFLDPSIPDLGAFAKRLSAIPLAYQPGERWHYGIGMDIAALVIERTSKQRFDAFLQDRILRPLKMTDTGFFVPESAQPRFASLYAKAPTGGLIVAEAAQKSPFLKPPVVATGSGGLVSTITDYFRFAQMLCNGGELDGVRVLSPASVDLMLANHLRDDQFGQLAEAATFGFGGTGTGVGFGYGGAVVRDTVQTASLGSDGEYKWGGAASTTFIVDRERDVVVVLMAQLAPSGTYPLGDVMKAMVYQALVDPKR